MSDATEMVIVCAAGFRFWVLLAYINLFKPVLWLRLPLGGERHTPQREQKILNDELLIAKCRTAGVFGIIGIIVVGYGLFVNVPKLF